MWIALTYLYLLSDPHPGTLTLTLDRKSSVILMAKLWYKGLQAKAEVTENPLVNRNRAGKGTCTGWRGWKTKAQSSIDDLRIGWKWAGINTASDNWGMRNSWVGGCRCQVNGTRGKVWEHLMYGWQVWRVTKKPMRLEVERSPWKQGQRGRLSKIKTTCFIVMAALLLWWWFAHFAKTVLIRGNKWL